jgi:hypothetical protein
MKFLDETRIDGLGLLLAQIIELIWRPGERLPHLVSKLGQGDDIPNAVSKAHRDAQL